MVLSPWHSNYKSSSLSSFNEQPLKMAKQTKLTDLDQESLPVGCCCLHLPLPLLSLKDDANFTIP